MSSCHTRIPNFEFKQEEIDRVKKNGGLLSMEIEFSLLCNFKCPYCYEPSINELQCELSKEELCDVIVQAKELGAQKIIILGGEPMLYPHVFEMIDFIADQGLAIQMFTNGCDITFENAQKLYARHVNIVLKMNTFNEKKQDLLSGYNGAFHIIQNAFKNLQDAGYPSKKAFIAISTIMCRQNIDELVTLWEWARDRNILPYIEMITPQGNATENDWLNITSEEAKKVFDEIQALDREKYKQEWDVQPPLVGNKCLRHHFSCLVNSKGDVMPCVGVTIPLGNIRRQKLKRILDDSEVIENLRKHNETIKGPCRTCDKADDCYGCRGAAYQLTGDYLGSDPLCWKNTGKKDEITYLPMSVNGLIPQQGSMQLVDTLLSVGERSAEVELTVKDTMPFIEDDQSLDTAVYLELIAQSAAVMHGFLKFDGIDSTKIKHNGFLLGAKKVTVHEKVFVGDTLKVCVEKLEKYGDFGVIRGIIFRGHDVVAHGEIMVWHTLQDNAQEMTHAK